MVHYLTPSIQTVTYLWPTHTADIPLIKVEVGEPGPDDECDCDVCKEERARQCMIAAAGAAEQPPQLPVSSVAGGSDAAAGGPEGSSLLYPPQLWGGAGGEDLQASGPPPYVAQPVPPELVVAEGVPLSEARPRAVQGGTSEAQQGSGAQPRGRTVAEIRAATVLLAQAVEEEERERRQQRRRGGRSAAAGGPGGGGGSRSSRTSSSGIGSRRME